jgi:hypothetical protein
MAGTISIPDNVHIGGKLTCDSFDPPEQSITADALTTSMQLGQIQLPLANWRELSAGATINAAGNGGLLASDSTPQFERVNGATDPQLRLEWAAGNVDAITISVASPPDLDNAESVTLKLRAKMAGATDTPVIAAVIFEDVGGSDIGGNTGALSNSLATVTRTFTPTASTSTVKAWSITLTPGAHGTDALELYSAWIEYTRK